jgi:hypothetical protein
MHNKLRLQLEPALVLRLDRLVVREIHPKPADAPFVVSFAILPFLEEGDAAVVAELAPPGCDAAPEPADAAGGAVDLFVFAAACGGGCPFDDGGLGLC